MLDWAIGKVEGIIEQNTELQILSININGQKKITAINYLCLYPPITIGQMVILNKTATELNLGTGGIDFVIAPILPEHRPLEKGHIMKLRYTPLQFSVLSVEEQDSIYHDIFTEEKKLDGLPVIVGELHSMLPIIVTLYRYLEAASGKKQRNVVYIMTDGGALPISFSKHVTILKNLGWLNGTITIGNAFGGDLEAINIYTGLIAAKYVLDADFVIVLMGPGITGTGTLLGHTGVEQGTIINAIKSLSGLPISIARASIADKRDRHYGISHHTISTLQYISLVESDLPYPSYLADSNSEIYQSLLSLQKKHKLIPIEINREDVQKGLANYPEQIKTMGKTYQDDHLYFDFVASTAYHVFNLLNK